MGRASAKKLRAVEPSPILKLDFGCGPHKRDGFTGVDQFAFPGVDIVVNLSQTVMPMTDYEDRDSAYIAKVLAQYEFEPKNPSYVAWPWADNSVTEAHASHFVEHLTAPQRFNFFNQLYRILVPNGTCQIIVPHWASCRAYGDLTHQWPPMGEFFWYYLSKDWRAGNAPHTDAQYRQNGLNCHFEATWGYSLRQDLTVRHPEFQQDAIANHKEAIMDMIATVKALK